MYVRKKFEIYNPVNAPVDLVAAALYFLNSSRTLKLSACRLTEDCEQRVRASESLDVCSPKFSFSRSEEAVRSQRSRMLCDVLLDQAVMPGVGNIIKNEALFDSGLHPAVKVWKRWWIVFSRGTKKRVKMQDNSQRESISPCIIEWCIAMRRVKPGKDKQAHCGTDTLPSRCSFEMFFVIFMMFFVFIESQIGVSLWFIIY